MTNMTAFLTESELLTTLGVDLQNLLNLEYIFTSTSWDALLTELALMTSVWSVIMVNAKDYWQKYFETKPYYKILKTRRGFLCKNHQTELVHLCCIAPHHAFGGSLMILGYLLSLPSFIRHGILWESAFNLYDYISMLFRLFPYDNKDNILISGILLMVVHHFGALCFGSFCIRSELINTEDVAVIGIALEAAAAISLATLAFSYTCDFKEDVREVWLVNIINCSCFLYTRGYLYTVCSFNVMYGLLTGDEKYTGRNSEPSWGFLTGAITTLIAFHLFNIYVVTASLKRSFKMTELLIDHLTLTYNLPPHYRSYAFKVFYCFRNTLVDGSVISSFLPKASNTPTVSPTGSRSSSVQRPDSSSEMTTKSNTTLSFSRKDLLANSDTDKVKSN